MRLATGRPSCPPLASEVAADLLILPCAPFAPYSLDASGVPKYMGATGTKLGTLITIAASMGFILFGYAAFTHKPPTSNALTPHSSHRAATTRV